MSENKLFVIVIVIVIVIVTVQNYENLPHTHDILHTTLVVCGQIYMQVDHIIVDSY